MLLNELYEKTFQVLERGDFRLEASSERARKVKRTVLELLENEYPAAQVREELKALTTRHVLSHSPAVLADHLRILLRLGDEQLIMTVTHEPEKSYSNFTIVTHDVPGLFAMITGVMAANGINILGAQIHTSKNGKALDILQVNSPQGFVITDQSRWQRVEDDMRRVLAREVQVETLVQKRRRPTLLGTKERPRFPTSVEIDNEVSVDYTVVDIYTHDQIGLLYRITSTLKELGLYIGVAKISTKVDQVADVFYVKDIFGHKITAEEKLEEIRGRLLTAIDEDAAP
jgi:[protein-PII] uridylyltransferase